MPFKNEAAEFVFVRTYARWLEEFKRRETWTETVQRYMSFIEEERKGKIPAKVLRKIKEKILSFDVMPSMRAMWAAGPAAKASHVTMYNCSALAVDSIESFSECLYILCCGAGVGFSVEKKYTDKLPVIQPRKQILNKNTFVIADQKEGWCDSVKELMKALYKGEDVDFDYSLIRAKGSPLVTMGGRASGPEPLAILHDFIRDIFIQAQSRKLSTLECHDIMNKIAEITVVGGVRRSSEISFSDLHDEQMKNAKNWPFPLHRAMANNSAVYNTKPSAVEFLSEWANLASSGTGERGIFNLEAVQNNAPKRRAKSLILLTNPCGEIALRDKEFCNLSEVVVRQEDDLDSLLDKVESAVWLGAIQSTFTDFPYLRPEWKKNCDEERLLGVSITGQMDAKHLLTPDALKALKSRALKVAKRASEHLGVSMPAAITCVKPSGTVSQVVSSGSGIHPWYSKYFIRRYRISANDPLFRLLKDSGIEVKPENGQKEKTANTFVVSFPMKAPEKAIIKSSLTALDQLEWYKNIQTNWCEHNASGTIYIKPDEWFEVGNWVYKNWDIINGLSFLPDDGGKYEQAPLEEITKEQYDEMVKAMPKIDYSRLSIFELEDTTEGAKALACSSGACEI